MREMNEVPGSGTPDEELLQERVSVFGDGGDFDIQCEYCGLPVYYRPGFCPTCGETVAGMDRKS